MKTYAETVAESVVRVRDRQRLLEDMAKARREGLVPKKVTVTKRGKTFQQTVYVRPGEKPEAKKKPTMEEAEDMPPVKGKPAPSGELARRRRMGAQPSPEQEEAEREKPVKGEKKKQFEAKLWKDVESKVRGDVSAAATKLAKQTGTNAGEIERQLIEPAIASAKRMFGHNVTTADPPRKASERGEIVRTLRGSARMGYWSIHEKIRLGEKSEETKKSEASLTAFSETLIGRDRQRMLDAIMTGTRDASSR